MKLAVLFERYLVEFPRASVVKRSILRRLKDDSLGRKKAPGTARDYIDLCRARREECAPQTVLYYVMAVRDVLAYAKPGWGLSEVTDAPIREAFPILKKEGLIGGSRRRQRRPTNEETLSILEYFRARGDLLMVDIVEFQNDSTRRIGETCRLRWGDVDLPTKTILVLNMKHPTRKNNHNRVALPDKSVEIIQRQPRNSSHPDERIFKVKSRTASVKYARAVHDLGIPDLHLHDCRRGGTTKLLEEGRSVWEVMLVTGHERPDLPLTTYNALQAEDFHKMRRAA